MKIFKKNQFAIIVLLMTIFTFSYCTKKNQVLDLTPDSSETPSTSSNTDTLFSLKVASGPTMNTGLNNPWNGNIEAIWNDASKLTRKCTVPNLGNNTFPGFVGLSTDVTLRSLYDANNIYFLAEWDAPKNLNTAMWYYNPTTKRWAQESGAAVIDVNGIETRPPFQQDGFTMMFNIDNSTLDFDTKGCYVACHAFTPSWQLDTLTGKIVTVPKYDGYMATNGPLEKLDCWRARMIQAVYANQANDVYIDWKLGAINSNAFNNDAQLKSTDGGTNNRQTQKTAPGTAKVPINIPMYVIKDKTNYSILTTDDTTSANGGLAVRVLSVDTNGVLLLKDGTTIDPRTATSGTDYQQIGLGDGPKCFPGTIVGLYSGSRADVIENAYYTGSGWRVMMSRALKTSDALKQDVDFSLLGNLRFGIGVMMNGANGEHAISNGLLLSFKK